MSLDRRSLLAAAPLVLGAGAARAQAAPPSRIRGTIDAVEGAALHVTSRAGRAMVLALPPDLPVTAVLPARLSDIGPHSYVGIAGRPQPDGTVQAIEVHIFPEAMRGAGEGHRPYDLEPQSTMTNGTVGSVVGTQGRTLTVSYQGGEKQVTVPATAPIVTFAPGTPAMLVPGAHIIAFATRTPDGGLRADRILVGKDGLVPPL